MSQVAAEFKVTDLEPSLGDMQAEVLAGLSAPRKTLSPKYFYDASGSQLFEQITDLPEYYLTRTEMALFDRHADQIAKHLSVGECIVEYGSGSNRKIKRLLEIVAPRAYVPIDISKEHLIANAKALHAAFPDLAVYPLCADFTQAVRLPKEVAEVRKTAFFPGSSIGNFDPADAQDFLTNVATTIGVGGRLLIGVDRKKDSTMLERAYDDGAGVTAEFNRNVLRHINQSLQADFEPEAFAHQAVYNERLGRIEMYLVSETPQRVQVAGETITFASGERIHTESSYKYDVADFTSMALDAGFATRETWSDRQELFSLYLLEVNSVSKRSSR